MKQSVIILVEGEWHDEWKRHHQLGHIKDLQVHWAYAAVWMRAVLTERADHPLCTVAHSIQIRMTLRQSKKMSGSVNLYDGSGCTGSLPDAHPVRV